MKLAYVLAILVVLSGCSPQGNKGIDASTPTQQGGGAPTSGDHGIAVNMPIAGGGGVAVLLVALFVLMNWQRNKAVKATDILLQNGEVRGISKVEKHAFRAMFELAGVEKLVEKRLAKLKRKHP